MTAKTRKLIIVVAVTALALIIVWLGSRPRGGSAPGNLSTLPAGQTAPAVEENPPVPTDDVVESFDPATVDQAARELADRIARYPWSQSLPYFSDHFQIFFKEGETAGVEIIVLSQTAAELERYRDEALVWLRAQEAPVGQLKMDITTPNQ